jgi:hypothetical protein
MRKPKSTLMNESVISTAILNSLRLVRYKIVQSLHT